MICCAVEVVLINSRTRQAPADQPAKPAARSGEFWKTGEGLRGVEHRRAAIPTTTRRRRFATAVLAASRPRRGTGIDLKSGAVVRAFIEAGILRWS
jgi:hypothetical protein